jgi:hypothetical protein
VRHRDDDVELATARAHEDGVGRVGAGRVPAFGASVGDGRRDVVDLLVAKQAALACVRIQAGHGDARRRQPHALERSAGDAQRLQHGLARHAIDGITQRAMDGHQHRAQLLVGQHHAHGDATGQRLQHLGVARIGRTARVQGFLVDGRGDQRTAPAGQDLGNSSLDAAGRRRPRPRIDATGWQLGQAGGQARRLPDGQAARRHAPQRVRAIERRHRQAAAQARQRGTHHLHIAHDNRIARCVGQPKACQDLGADATGVTLSQQQRQAICHAALSPPHLAVGRSPRGEQRSAE